MPPAPPPPPRPRPRPHPAPPPPRRPRTGGRTPTPPDPPPRPPPPAPPAPPPRPPPAVVLGPAAIADHSHRTPEDAALEPADERGRRIAVARGHAGHECLVRRTVHDVGTAPAPSRIAGVTHGNPLPHADRRSGHAQDHGP